MQTLQRCRAGAVAALFAMLAVMPPCVAADVEIAVRQDAVRIEINASALIDADAAVAWRVLTDYARYPDFIPGIRNCRIVRRNGSMVTVEQDGSALFGPVQVPIAIVYEITESPPGELWSSAEIGKTGRLQSHYAMKPAGLQVQLVYVGRLETSSKPFRFIEQAVARQTVSRQFQALADEIERAAGTPPRPGKKRGEDGLLRAPALTSGVRPA